MKLNDLVDLAFDEVYDYMKKNVAYTFKQPAQVISEIAVEHEALKKNLDEERKPPLYWRMYAEKKDAMMDKILAFHKDSIYAQKLHSLEAVDFATLQKICTLLLLRKLLPAYIMKAEPASLRTDNIEIIDNMIRILKPFRPYAYYEGICFKSFPVYFLNAFLKHNLEEEYCEFQVEKQRADEEPSEGVKMLLKNIRDRVKDEFNL